jgi:hypothetical protein
LVRLAAQRLSKRGGTARHAGLYQDNIPVVVARDRKGATFDAVLPQVDGASVEAALAGVVTPGNHLIGDGGKAIAAFARRAGIPFHAVPAPGKPTRETPHLRNAYHGRLKQWLARFNGVATSQLRRDFQAPRALGDQRRLQGGDVVGKSLGSGIHEAKGIIVFAIRGALKYV